MVWKPGHGAHRKIVRNPASLCHRLGDISFEVAAALPIALTTACYALREVARLQRGETILIHSAGNGIGQIAVQLAQVRNYKLYQNLAYHMYSTLEPILLQRRARKTNVGFFGIPCLSKMSKSSPTETSPLCKAS